MGGVTHPVVSLSSAFHMTNAMFPLSAADVLEVLTEVDERSRRSPEIIQYFIVSRNQTQEGGRGCGGGAR